MYQNKQEIESTLSKLNISDNRYVDHSVMRQPPEIPPKPSRSNGAQMNGQSSGLNLYANQRPQVDSYYAVNAPAPGTVGMASARINRGYSDNPHTRSSNMSAQQQYSSANNSQRSTPVNQLYSNTNNLRSTPVSQTGSVYQNQQTINQYPPALPPKPKENERALYSNIQNTQNSNYASFGVDEEFPPPPAAFDETTVPQSPPSPVSSSYSELHNVHNLPARKEILSDQHQPNKFATYTPPSQTSSNYESIYEPISPRPDSQMSQISSRRGYDPLRANLYGPFTSPNARGLAPVPSPQPVINPDTTGKEADVDALANLLVHSMDSSNDPEFFGICAQCGSKVVGEGTGCTAMEQVYHISCFCCAVCFLKLQGKPFYDLEKKPYCQDCYLNTLEKCSVCTAPILDRILRATGKPYHPGCFTCVVCSKSLDGIPFTVDASNQIHCIDDFHKKFAPRCSVCTEPIMPESGQEETVRVVALDRSFHVKCYKCEDCGLLLSSEAEGRGCYPLDGHVLCKSCNAKRVQALTSKVTTEL